jgi:hypothetical protein
MIRAPVLLYKSNRTSGLAGGLFHGTNEQVDTNAPNIMILIGFQFFHPPTQSGTIQNKCLVKYYLTSNVPKTSHTPIEKNRY